MFCNQCGASLPEGSKFCSTCGADLTAAPVAAPAAPEPQPVAPPSQPAPGPNSGTVSKPPKKKVPIWLTVVIVLAVFLLGKFVIAPSMLSEPNDTEDSSGSQTQDTSSSDIGTDINTANPAYDAILTEAYIVHFQPFFMMDTESFVLKQEDGIICCADYGYDADVVKQWVETIYIPISEYTDTQKTELENTMKTQFATVEALNCCTITYNMSTNYFTITCTYSDVDKAENYGELYNAQVLQTNTFISMSATETALLGQGFIKK